MKNRSLKADPSATTPAPNAGKIAYRIKEAVAASGLSRSMLYKLMDEERLSSVRIGNCRLILGDSLRNLIENAHEG